MTTAQSADFNKLSSDTIAKQGRILQNEEEHEKKKGSSKKGNDQAKKLAANLFR